MPEIKIKSEDDGVILFGGGTFDGVSLHMKPLPDGTLRVSVREVIPQRDAFGGVIQATDHETLNVAMTLEEIIAKLR